MGYKFNPFTGKLDMTGASESQIAEELMIDNGVVFTNHGGLGKNYDFAQKPMSVKSTLETIIFPDTRATVAAKTGNVSKLEGLEVSYTPKFEITKNSFEISSITIVRLENGSEKERFTIANDSLPNISFESNGGINNNDVLGALNSNRNLTITLPTVPGIAVNNTWTCKVYERKKDSQDNFDRDLPTAVESVSFYYPRMFIYARTSIIKDFVEPMLHLDIDTTANNKLSIVDNGIIQQNGLDTDGFISAGLFGSGAIPTQYESLSATKLTMDYQQGTNTEGLIVITKGDKFNGYYVGQSSLFSLPKKPIKVLWTVNGQAKVSPPLQEGWFIYYPDMPSSGKVEEVTLSFK